MTSSGSGDPPVDDPGGGPGSSGLNKSWSRAEGWGAACIWKVYEFWVWLRYVEQVCPVGLERGGEI